VFFPIQLWLRNPKGRSLTLQTLSEKWFNTRHINRQVGLHVFRAVRADMVGRRRGEGGLHLLHTDNLSIELRLPYPFLVCAIYNHPNINVFSIFGSELEPLISKYSDLLILGDFNHDVLAFPRRMT
jgi:hypothetical protein